jgi:hypothetical protein
MEPQNRIASIDIIRALTMLLMIFVNDLWTLHDIPGWLEHAKAHEDAMGLADVVFPAFLFIVGLSIPFAIEARRKKSESDLQILLHIGKRALALVIMGFFMVNLENASSKTLLINEQLWQILMALSFVLIWNSYPSDKIWKKIPVWVFEYTGILILICLVLVYRGGNPDAPHGMRTHWWGILGLIGWAYLLCAIIYLIAGKKLWWIGIALGVLVLLNIQEFSRLSGMPRIWIIVSASNYTLVMCGVLGSVLYMKLNQAGKRSWFIASLWILALLMITFGFLIRPYWGISKILATPSWSTICGGISFAVMGLLYFIADVMGFTKWAGIIAPAGTSTLTCYLVPYFYYAFMDISGVRLPEILRGGIIGLIKSLLFALLIIWITGVLERMKIKLKI